jgi:hypothetical protein
VAPLRTVRDTLDTADYSLRGLEHVIAIERKSLPDLIAIEREHLPERIAGRRPDSDVFFSHYE